MKDFEKEYLAMQGVLILPPCRKPSRPYERREEQFVPVVPEYERGGSAMTGYRVFNPKNGDLLKKKFKTFESAQSRIDQMKKAKYYHVDNLVVKEW